MELSRLVVPWWAVWDCVLPRFPYTEGGVLKVPSLPL